MSTILLVEDEPLQSQLYAEELSDCGYEVLTASNGTQALQQAAEKRPDLVVLDLNLVGIDGLQILEKLLEQHPQLPVIIHSAYDYQDRFITWCAEDYVVKSSDLSALKNSVATVLASHATAAHSHTAASETPLLDAPVEMGFKVQMSH